MVSVVLTVARGICGPAVTVQLRSLTPKHFPAPGLGEGQVMLNAEKRHIIG